VAALAANLPVLTMAVMDRRDGPVLWLLIAASFVFAVATLVVVPAMGLLLFGYGLGPPKWLFCVWCATGGLLVGEELTA
jgi:hypothetical protein